MLEGILEGARGLGAEELYRGIEMLKVLVVEALAGPEEEPSRCPRCGGAEFVRKGFDTRRGKDGSVADRTQRYLCGGCGRTFTRRTCGLLTRSKLGAGKWVRFVDLMAEHRPLKECARLCGVSEPTAFFMRHRICQVMGAALPAFSCGEGESAQVDGTYLNESLKGCGMRGGEGMPREAHRTGHDVHARGISNEKVCVIGAVKDDGSFYLGLCDRGRPSDDAVAGCLEGRVGPGASVATDALGAYGRVLPALGVGSHDVYPSDGSRGDGLGRVNSLHRRLRDWLRPLNGVSTKYFDMYIAWFSFEELMRRRCRDLVGSMLALVAEGRYALTRRRLTRRARPFADYWEGKSPTIDPVAIWGEQAA